MARLSDEQDFRARFDRQNGAVVLQQDSAFDDHALGKVVVLGAGGVTEVGRRPRPIDRRALTVDLPSSIDRSQYLARQLVDPALGELAAQVAVVLSLRHLDVQAMLCGGLAAVHGAPIADHEALETEVLAQQLPQQLAILASVFAIDLIVGAHHCASACINGRLEGQHVDLVLCTVADVDVQFLAVLLLVVVQPMLHRGDEATTLDLSHVGGTELAAQVGVLTREALEGPAAELDAGHLDIGTQEDGATLRAKLLGNGRAKGSSCLGVEARGHGDQVRELRAFADCGIRIAVVALRTVIHRESHLALRALDALDADVASVA
mmetsp:Transcript_5752/g.14614  ORF Transcript_5752/g.14614 Transcript_5752/m.14614 type:complete len:321 (+) Transcript_5752:1261-2223(+)